MEAREAAGSRPAGTSVDSRPAAALTARPATVLPDSGPAFGGVEAGGTKVICVVGTGPDDIRASVRIPLGAPGATIAAAVRFFEDVRAAGTALRAVGVASFGPLEIRPDHLDHGRITATTKAGWSGVDMLGPFVDALGVPAGVETDVNAAAIAEGRWGAARGLDSFVYLTLGTGIGGGAVVDGRIVHGLRHPEMGHVAVDRLPGDDFAGVCPFHRDCWEGLASGPAIEARFGRRAEELEGAERDRAAELAGFYLAAGIRSLTYALAPARFVVGGGLAELPGLLEAARRALPAQLAGYPGLPEHDMPEFVMPAGLSGMAGPLGAIAVAQTALEGGGTATPGREAAAAEG
jgi:fructokinase